MNKNIKVAFAVFLIFITSIIAYGTVKAMGVEPGSDSDPLVSKSYVDKKINEVIGLFQSVEQNNKGSNKAPSSGTSESREDKNNSVDSTIDMNQILEQVDVLMKIRLSEYEQNLNGSEVTIPTYEKVFVENGKVIIGEKGTEMILRAGEARAVEGEFGGLADVTQGVDWKNNELVPLNHLLIISDTDGRGLSMTKDSWLIIRGKYQVIG